MNPHREKELGIYIHIPFCVRKCRYCDFLSAPADESVREQYVQQLCREIAACGPDRAEGTYRVVSIFLGGGTPSVLTGEQIRRILQAAANRFGISRGGRTGSALPEITVECNPGTLTRKKLQDMREAGVNRLSIGLQSANDAELAALGRIHRWQDFLDSYQMAREEGFSNINVDLMSGLPGQTRAGWRSTLQRVLSLSPAPEHISAYSLIIEEGTPFFEQYHEDDLMRSSGEQSLYLPSEEEERLMYEDTRCILSEYGLLQYEISNYAKPGYESLHNCGYWERREYLGFGLGASSQIDHCRYKKTDRLNAYLDNDFHRYDLQRLSREDEMEETMFLGLRMRKGVSAAVFRERFGTDLGAVYGPVIQKQQEEGLVSMTDGRLQLTDRGMDLSNMVMAEYLLDR